MANLQDSIRSVRGSINGAPETMHMPYKLLKEITGNFSNELGRGSFGKVYKGRNDDGQDIAVKLLHSNLLDVEGREFAREFNSLTKLKHPNIVRLVGFCDDEEQVHTECDGKTITGMMMRRALCFEYLEEGSLQKHLSDEHHGFDWEKRYTIIKGICMGLKYLHMELESPVHHLDLKPDNVLLDINMVPKIADFGLSRLIGEQNTKKTIAPLGTLGYCPPEYFNGQTISKEFDIYSLGVIIIKIICGPAAHSPKDGTRPIKFIRQVHKKWRETLRARQGYTPLEVEEDCQQVKRCIELALRCTDPDRKKRPHIGYIVDKLAETENRKKDKAYVMDEGRSLNFPVSGGLPASFVKEITDNFAYERELSHSAHGTLYKGILQEGGVIAVLRLPENTPVAPQKVFRIEITNIMALKHENILELVGFCNEQYNKLVEYNGRYIIAEGTECCLCYKYLHNGRLDRHMYGETRSINWDTRFKIIKGICQGLLFLHKKLEKPFLHLGLAPSSIWLDDNWVPKIANFGFSKIFGQEKTRKNTRNHFNEIRYMAPEYLYNGEISARSDIYSLGLLIMEIATGERNYYTSKDSTESIENVYEHWRTYEKIIYNYPSIDPNAIQQVKACIVIGLKCVQINQNKRPSIFDIVNKLNGKRVRIFDQMSPLSLSQEYTMHTSPVLLDVHPEQLRIPSKPDKLFSCPLQLTNMTDNSVAARLLTKNKWRYAAKMPLCAVVPPKSTYTFVLTMSEQKNQSSLYNPENLSLDSRVVPEGLGLENAASFSKFFKEANEFVADTLDMLEVASDRPIQYEIQVISDMTDMKFLKVMSVDVHLTEPWIMTSHHGGDIIIWDYQEQEIETSFDFTKKPVYSAKFIELGQWLVAGDGDGTIYVYSYDKDEEVKTILGAHDGEITCLVVHPTYPFVISSSDDCLIKLWDWEKGWECTQIFEGHSDRVTQLNFNPIDTNSFVSASLDSEIKIWNISSSDSKITLSDHPDELLCVQNYTIDTRHYLITGSSDGTAQIWDLETETCVQTLRGPKDSISSVYHHPKLPVLITGSHDGAVHLWNSSTYRLENIIAVNLGAVYAFGYIERVSRIVVACEQGVAIVEMNYP